MSRVRPNTEFWKNLGNTHRLLALVWQSAPTWLMAMIGITIVGSLIPVILLYVNKLIIDWISTRAGQSAVVWMPIVLLILARLGLSLSKAGLGEARPFISQILSDRLTLTATRRLLQQSARLDLNHFESPDFYDALNRATQSGSSYPVRALDYATNLVGQSINLIGVIVLLLQFNPIILFLLLLTFFPLLTNGVNFSKKKFMLNRKNTFEGRLASYFQGLLTQQLFAKEVRLFDLGDHLIAQWEQTFNHYKKDVERMARHQALGRFGVVAIPNLSFYAAYAWIIVRTVQGTITLGDFVMYSGAFSQAQTLLTGCAQNLANTYDANLYVAQFFEFLSLKPKIVSPVSPQPFPHPIQHGIELKNVGFAYPGTERSIYKDINFRVHPGESIAVVGVNGAGKTTLVKLLTRLYDADQGTITIDGIPLSDFELKDLHRNIAVLFQDFARYKLGIQENIGFGDIENWQSRSQALAAADKAGIAEFIDSLEHGYQTKLGNLFPQGRELSGGQWQKIGLSRAFMSQAQILILDEPTAAMDALAEADLYKRFKELTRGKITFFISHRFSSVRLADRILVLDGGQIAELGTHEELIQQKGLYARMFNLQASGYAR
ncbi:MAG: ABC transporter ATP-binding protein [Cyanobacteria bacterium P01_F01_bin.86]